MQRFPLCCALVSEKLLGRNSAMSAQESRFVRLSEHLPVWETHTGRRATHSAQAAIQKFHRNDVLHFIPSLSLSSLSFSVLSVLISPLNIRFLPLGSRFNGLWEYDASWEQDDNKSNSPKYNNWFTVLIHQWVLIEALFLFFIFFIHLQQI